VVVHIGPPHSAHGSSWRTSKLQKGTPFGGERRAPWGTLPLVATLAPRPRTCKRDPSARAANCVPFVATDSLCGTFPSHPRRASRCHRRVLCHTECQRTRRTSRPLSLDGHPPEQASCRAPVRARWLKWRATLGQGTVVPLWQGRLRWWGAPEPSVARRPRRATRERRTPTSENEACDLLGMAWNDPCSSARAHSYTDRQPSRFRRERLLACPRVDASWRVVRPEAVPGGQALGPVGGLG
jgi:hypothetical protein